VPTRHRDFEPVPRVADGQRLARSADLAGVGRPSREWYLRLAAHLDEIEARTMDEGDLLICPILSALRELCVACGDCCAVAEGHDRARDAALARERDLRRDIHVVLETLTQAELPDRDARKTQARSHSRKAGGMKATEGSPDFAGLRRFQALFGDEIDALAIATEGDSDPTSRAGAAPGGEAPAARSQSPAEARPSPSLAAYCLGSYQVYLDDQLIEEWPGHKALSLFKYLLLNRRRRVLKDVLYELFWPGVDPESCRRNLHQAIYSLRHTLRRHRSDIPYLLFEDDCYLLNPYLDIWVDVEEFDEHAVAGEKLQASRRPDAAMAEYGLAEALYRGHLFEECLYEDWAAIERERLRSSHMHIAGRLADMFIERRDYSAATVLCQKALSLDRCDESAHRRLMHCYVAQGQRHLALRQFRACTEALRTDFGLEPSEETVALNDALN
jgi:DNA-binding SARP family transcriptional activator